MSLNIVINMYSPGVYTLWVHGPVFCITVLDQKTYAYLKAMLPLAGGFG
jgi:hypothetical protein